MAERSVPAHTANSSPRTCGNCNGAGGHTITIRTGQNTIRETWQPCGPCHGTGIQGGGI
jgi:DnaJ-class molecular chaperone